MAGLRGAVRAGDVLEGEFLIHVRRPSAGTCQVGTSPEEGGLVSGVRLEGAVLHGALVIDDRHDAGSVAAENWLTGGYADDNLETGLVHGKLGSDQPGRYQVEITDVELRR